ncbi:DUF5795 family protein [Halorussus aquaticus]|uniref:DUF5795 family protein n=1 Tax=Halorussus aquaticus TaxID=2953748 RepID=A0ABD5PWU4_9EURY|nr:DUF5795 family protein [Halorussus aquaticus]
MTANRVVQGRMVTAESLAEMIEGEDVMDAESIEDADRECPECGSDVLEVGYMPSVTAFVTGWKCQECDWSDTDRE